jgi:HNH endonuclease
MTSAGTRPGLTGTSPELVCRTGYESTATASCSTRRETRPLPWMAPDRSKKSGYRSQCRECRRTYDRRRYEKQWRSILDQQRSYRMDHREFGWAADHRRRAQRYGLDLITELVTADQLIARWGDKCFYCHGGFEVIDHRVPVAAGGHHTVENVVPCCRGCNQTKRWSFDERMIRAYREVGSRKPWSLVGQQSAVHSGGQA